MKTSEKLIYNARLYAHFFCSSLFKVFKLEILTSLARSIFCLDSKACSKCCSFSSLAFSLSLHSCITINIIETSQVLVVKLQESGKALSNYTSIIIKFIVLCNKQHALACTITEGVYLNLHFNSKLGICDVEKTKNYANEYDTHHLPSAAVLDLVLLPSTVPTSSDSTTCLTYFTFSFNEKQKQFIVNTQCIL